MSAIDGDSSELVFALRWVVRLAAFVLVFLAVGTLSSHPSVAYGPHDSHTAECSTVFSVIRGMGPPHTKAGTAAPAAESQCNSVARSDLRTSGVLLGAAVVLVGISLIPKPDRKQPAPGWFQYEGKWYPPHFEGKLPVQTSTPTGARHPTPL